MTEPDDHVEKSTEDVRGGSSENVVRYVLIVGTVLAIVLLTIIWISGALST